MIFRLSEQQLQWVLEGVRRPGDTVVSLYRDHYVHGIPKSECAIKHGLTRQFAYKKWLRFESLFEKKCKKYNLKVATLLLRDEDLQNVMLFDVPNSSEAKQKKQKNS